MSATKVPFAQAPFGDDAAAFAEQVGRRCRGKRPACSALPSVTMKWIVTPSAARLTEPRSTMPPSRTGLPWRRLARGDVGRRVEKGGLVLQRRHREQRGAEHRDDRGSRPATSRWFLGFIGA